LVEKQHCDEVGTYVDFRQDICPWLTIDAGLRVDWHSVVGTELVPQGGLSFHPTRNADIKALVSKGFRNPIIREMYMFPPATTDLLPESMMNYEIAYTQRIGKKAHIGANIFYIKGKNLINTVRIDGRPRNVNTGDFENWGIELSADYAINRHWSVNGNYSFLRMDTPIVGAPEGKLYVGGKYNNEKWTVTAGLQNISGLYITTGANTQKENFTLLNATVSYKVLPWMAIFAKGDNLLAERYQTYDGFYMPKATFMGGVNIDF
jgi:iron complex outermembrane receptor protein